MQISAKTKPFVLLKIFFVELNFQFDENLMPMRKDFSDGGNPIKEI